MNKNVRKLVLGLALGLLLVGCGNKNENKKNDSNLKVEEKESNQTENKQTSSNVDEKLTELANKENDIMAKHSELWNKVFEKADKDMAEKSKEMPYEKYLEDLIEKSKADLSEDDMKIINEDLLQIKEIEKEISMLKQTTENKENKEEKSGSNEKFPAFKSKTLDGEEVSSDIFKEKSVTLVNFWFNGCAPCVRELPELQKLNEEIEKKGGQVIGINTEAMVGNDDAIKEAKDIISKQGVKYKNISLDPSSDLGEYAGKIMSFPTSVLVDKNGNIVGDPIVGGMDSEKVMESVKEKIDEIIKESK